jgi:ribosomal protein S18 acetylase RimI-like enzyme
MSQIRSMTAADLPAVMQIQAQCYAPSLLESAAVIARRLHNNPQQCWVAEDTLGVCAYLFAYPSKLGSITPLDGDFPRHAAPDCLYLHDLAVANRAAGRGIGPQLVAHGLNHARDQALPWSALVSVQDSAGFWNRQGFAQEPTLDERQRGVLQSYRIPARYLVCPLVETA